MPGEAAKLTEYVVLRLIQEAKPAPPTPADSDETPKAIPETWAVVDTVEAHGSIAARKAVVKANLTELRTAKLVAVPSQSWQPAKPKVREQEPIIDFEDA